MDVLECNRSYINDQSNKRDGAHHYNIITPIFLFFRTRNASLTRPTLAPPMLASWTSNAEARLSFNRLSQQLAQSRSPLTPTTDRSRCTNPEFITNPLAAPPGWTTVSSPSDTEQTRDRTTGSSRTGKCAPTHKKYISISRKKQFLKLQNTLYKPFSCIGQIGTRRYQFKYTIINTNKMNVGTI